MAVYKVAAEDFPEVAINATTPYSAVMRYLEEELTDAAVDEAVFEVIATSEMTGAKAKYMAKAHVSVHWTAVREKQQLAEEA